jgi:hypothetical protein
MKEKLKFDSIEELPFSKRKQCGHPKQDRLDRETAFRNIYIAIVALYYREVIGIQASIGCDFCMAGAEMLPLNQLQLSHIEKKSQGRKYDFDNVQLLCHHHHELQEVRHIAQDLRTPAFKQWLKKYLMDMGE